jgi:hypothetical protein
LEIPPLGAEWPDGDKTYVVKSATRWRGSPTVKVAVDDIIEANDLDLDLLEWALSWIFPGDVEWNLCSCLQRGVFFDIRLYDGDYTLRFCAFAWLSSIFRGEGYADLKGEAIGGYQ